MSEPIALRYDFDGNGYLYMDAGSGSDWASRVKNCEFLYTHPMRNEEDDDIFRKEQVEKFYAEARPLREKYKLCELTDEEIIEEIKNIYGKKFDFVGYEEEMQLCRNVLKKASKK